ncbi:MULTISPECIES: sulfite exporter TauE/SafE family protein [unclassified Sedimentibacter]|uniref:sulfite exporter TauE/SafE family protein n=1 Tax=unclassified Sedimentibacter TaxID=2649220 RepID=UPI0027E12F2D|nr:sulfite exporter TauE/SafE family protein [Sedimentibacter sp. MB35-C1]WMJ78175.1 sulfite exporter TauE/SafE family protein [Sedimentibacter sp. MB35-C1]
MVSILLSVLGLFTLAFLVVFLKDFFANKNNLEEETNWLKSGIIGLLTNFFDTLGIGSFAPTTALLRTFKQIKDRVIPGTLNVSCTVPVVIEAFAFITVVKVEPITLTSMLVAAVLGSVLGAGYVSKMPEKKIQLIMGVALLATAFLMFSKQLGWIAGLGTGTEIGLTGAKLIAAVVGNFILGALMTAGIGLYAPCMALVYILGMSPAVAFPVMMGSCAFLMPVASIKFVKEGAYNRKVSLAITIGGIIGVLLAVFVFTSLPLDVLTWLVIAVVTYTGITLLKASMKEVAIEAAETNNKPIQ